MSTPLEQPWCPVQELESLVRRLNGGNWIISDLGLEKRCGQCGDFWPADTYFWSPNKSAAGGLHSMCRDCLQDYKRARKEAGQALGVAA